MSEQLSSTRMQASPPVQAPVAQGIERRPPEAEAQVRILPGAPRFFQVESVAPMDDHGTAGPPSRYRPPLGEAHPPPAPRSCAVRRTLVPRTAAFSPPVPRTSLVPEQPAPGLSRRRVEAGAGWKPVSDAGGPGGAGCRR